jgi:predicted MFS family arabinose efflux permease
VLAGFGVGGLLGSVVGGRLGDRRPYATTISAAVATAVVLFALSVLSGQTAFAVVLVTLLGFAGLTANPVLISLAVRFGGDAPTLASGLSTAAFNAGTAVGSWLASLTLGSALAEGGPATIGAVTAVLLVVPLTLLARRPAGWRPAHGAGEGLTEPPSAAGERITC